MAHPHKKESSSAHNAKLRAMTRDYGLASGPANNIKAPMEMLKGEGPEANVGFGADSSNMTAKRGDRPARRTAAANPLATYARGGKVKEACGGGVAEKATGGVIARARGGRAKGATHVNVIVSPQAAPATPPVPPQLAALAGAPPAPPMMAPPGPPPMPPGGGPGGPPMPMRARGGKVMGDHPDESQDKDLIERTLKEEGLIEKARGGGIHMTAGAATGIGRLEKMGITARHRGSMAPKAV